jgi:SAM-dependent methyltransferase
MPPESSLTGADRLHGIAGTWEVVTCKICGSGLTLPAVAEEDLGSLYPEEYTAYGLPVNPALRLLALLLFRSRYRRALGRRPLVGLRSLSPGRLLDVGSGRGDLGVVLRQKGWDVTGLEPSEQACQEARTRGVETVRGTLQTSGSSLPGDYDAIVFQHSLEHTVDPARDLALARDLLRDDGILVVSVPNFGCWQRQWLGSQWFHLDLPRHRSHFTPQGLEILLRRTSFESLDLGTSTSADGLPMSIQYRLFGRRRFVDGPALYASIALSLAVTPLSAMANGLGGGGDFLHAVGRKRAAEAPAA